MVLVEYMLRVYPKVNIAGSKNHFVCFIDSHLFIFVFFALDETFVFEIMEGDEGVGTNAF